ncbi:membrane-associating domain-containing protein [Xylogone sp. PMI_703]|nr:membrane-associating domain-containing protein [Xylogone sp. PMI_703]
MLFKHTDLLLHKRKILIKLFSTPIVAANWSWAGSEWLSSKASFFLFCSIWTIAALIYLAIIPTYLPNVSHKFGVLAVDFVTMVFWFAGFIAMATNLTDVNCRGHMGVCRAAEAACVFGAFEWLLFTATTVLALIQCTQRSRKHKTRKHSRAHGAEGVPEVLPDSKEVV